MKDLDSRSGESKIKNGERNGFLTRTSVLLSALVLPIKWRHSGQQPNKKSKEKTTQNWDKLVVTREEESRAPADY
jgi:hypothetical protein